MQGPSLNMPWTTEHGPILIWTWFWAGGSHLDLSEAGAVPDLAYSCLEYGPELQERAKAVAVFKPTSHPGAFIALHKMGIGKHNLRRFCGIRWSLQYRAYCPCTLMFVLASSVLLPASGKQGLQVIVLVFAANMALHYGEQKRNRGTLSR